MLLVFLLFVAVINPYSFLNSKYFVLNTSLFTFCIILCISIYNNMHNYGRSTDLISQAKIYMVEHSYSVTGTNYCPYYYPPS